MLQMHVFEYACIITIASNDESAERPRLIVLFPSPSTAAVQRRLGYSSDSCSVDSDSRWQEDVSNTEENDRYARARSFHIPSLSTDSYGEPAETREYDCSCSFQLSSRVSKDHLQKTA